MSDENSVTVPMVAYLSVPAPVDANGNPVPADYSVEVEPTVIQPQQRQTQLQSELEKRIKMYKAILVERGDEETAEKLAGAEEFTDFILKGPRDERQPDAGGSAASPRVTVHEVSVKAADENHVARPRPSVAAASAPPPPPAPQPCAPACQAWREPRSDAPILPESGLALAGRRNHPPAKDWSGRDRARWSGRSWQQSRGGSTFRPS